MPRNNKPGPSTSHAQPSSFLSMLTGWVQQGVENFFATQRVLVDVAMRQNTMAMKSLREGLSDPEHSPVAVLSELAVEGTSSFIEVQKILLNLAQQENDILLGAAKERVAGSPRMVAVTDLVRRSLDTFVKMQHDFLKLTSKQTRHWLDAVKAGKGYHGTHLVDLAREGMETFVQAQKKFLDVVAQESTKLAGGKHEPAAGKAKKIELSQLAREATNAFVEAQKKLLDVVGEQMNVNLKAATRTMDLMSPSRFLPMAGLTGEGVKSFVEAEKALIESMIKPRHGAKVVTMRERHRRAARPRKAQRAAARATA